MKKFILLIFLSLIALSVLSNQTYAQTKLDCRKAFDKESYQCLLRSGECSDACQEKTKKPDGSIYFNSGEIYTTCMKESGCSAKSDACYKKAQESYYACLDVISKAKENLPKEAVTEEQSDQSNQTSPIESKTPAQAISDWIMENELTVDVARIERLERENLDVKFYGRTPQMTEEIIKEAQEDWRNMFESPKIEPEISLRARVDYIRGDADYKLLGSDEWIPVKTGDVIPPGATLFTGMDATLVFSVQDMGVFQMLPFTEITVSEENIKGASHTDIKLNTGDIEVSVEGGVYTSTLQISTPTSIAGVKGTHFWVSYVKDKRLAITGVYKGEVEVTARDSNQSASVSPNGDKPGVVVVTQKLSLVKLGMVSLVLIAIIGSTVVFLKKRSKRRK